MQLENIQVNKLSCPEFNTLAQGLISRFPKGCSSPFYYTPPRSLYDIHIIGWDYTKSKIVPVNALQIAHVTVCKASPLSYLSCNKEANTSPTNSTQLQEWMIRLINVSSLCIHLYKTRLKLTFIVESLCSIYSEPYNSTATKTSLSRNTSNSLLTYSQLWDWINIPPQIDYKAISNNKV